jgi:mRNA interferase RelE/StbE
LTDAKHPYAVRFTKDAAADVKSLNGSVKKQLKKVLEKKLAVNPEAYGIPLRAPLAGYWKHPFASRRVIYRIYPDRQLVVVCAVGPRKAGDKADVYEELRALAKAGKLAEQIAEVLQNIFPGGKKAGPRES